jgi:hypothetical protein
MNESSLIPALVLAGFGGLLIYSASRGTAGMKNAGVADHAIGIAILASFGGFLIGIVVALLGLI